MNIKNTNYVSLVAAVIALIMISFSMGASTKAELHSWYSALNHSPLSPPNYLFGIVWSVLYAVIATCGWTIWRQQAFPQLILIKTLYIIQLILNWSWTPLFFRYHLTACSFTCLLLMNIILITIIYLTYNRIRLVSLLMMPYLAWLIFASYLNFYIWQYN